MRNKNASLNEWKIMQCLGTKSTQGGPCLTPDGPVEKNNCKECRYHITWEEDDEKREKVWRECLALWKELSRTKSRVIKHNRTDMDAFKNSVLRKIGIPKRRNGCPFCDKYLISDEEYELDTCRVCPLGNCYCTPYADWEAKAHDQAAAISFYQYLLELHEMRRG